MYLKNYASVSITNALALALIIFLTTVKGLYGCTGFESYDVNHKYTVEKPKLEFDHVVGLSKYIQYDSKMNNTILVNKTGLQIQFNCWAPFPIDFNFSGHVSTGLDKDELTVRIFRKPFSLDKYQSTQRICYGINVSLPAYEATTGNYSCFAVANISRMQSYYIFVSPSPPGVLLKRGQNLEISRSPRATSVVFPCAVSNPDAKIRLIRDGRDELRVDNRLLSFDPKIGFTLSLSTGRELWKYWTNYQCTSEQSPQDIVNIVLRRKEFFVAPKSPNIRSTKNLSLTCQANEPIYFKFRSTNTFNYSIDHEENSLKYHYDFVTKFQSTDIKSDVNGWISCAKNSTDEEIYKWTFAVLANDKTGLRPFTDSIKSACGSTANLTFCKQCNNWIECNINKCLSKDKSCTATKCTSFAEFPNAVMQCLNPNILVSEIYFTGLNTTKQYNNWPTAPINDILRVDQVTDQVGPHAESIQFSCEGSSFVFASGFHWFYSTKNVSKKDIPEEYKIQEVKQVWGKTKAILKSILDLRNLPTDTTYIICSAPVWNSTEWKEVSMKVNPLSTNTHSKTNYKTGNTKSSSNLIKADSGFGYLYKVALALYIGAPLFFRSILFKV